MTDPLAILFGNQARVKLLRFFLFNPTREFSFDDISRRAKLVRRTARTEMNALERAGVIKKKMIYVAHKSLNKKVRSQGYTLNLKFPQLESLQTFFFETAPLDAKTVMKHLHKAGPLDFVATTGIFMREYDRRLDLLVSMKKVNEQKVDVAIRSLEAEIGVELRFAAFNSDDLMYRIGMHDKLTRDVFDYPYQVLKDKIGIRDELIRP